MSIARRAGGVTFRFFRDGGAAGKVVCADAITGGGGGASIGRIATISFDDGFRSRLDGACGPSSDAGDAGAGGRIPIAGVIDRPLISPVADRLVTASDLGPDISTPLSVSPERLAAASIPLAGRRLGSRSIIRSTAAARVAGTSGFSR
jgi:hypothetical protein